MNLPFAIIDTGAERLPVLVGQDKTALVGFAPSDPGVGLYVFEPEDIVAVVNVDPPAVFSDVRAAYAAMVWDRAVANRARKKLPTFVAKGSAFPVMPEGVLSGFPVAARTIRKHRNALPTLDTILVSAIFAVSTVRVRIEQAEVAYDCFGDLYKARGRTMPSAQDLKSCFQGLQNTKSAMFEGVAAYAPTILQAMTMGYRDRELRSVLALDSNLPNGLGLAKLSFTLALLGQDTICLDGRLLGTMFSRAQRTRFEKGIGKDEGVVTSRALLTYEAAEDAFLADNRYYDVNDPIGRARAQWLSWEAVGGKGASHSVWLDLLQEDA